MNKGIFMNNDNTDNSGENIKKFYNKLVEERGAVANIHKAFEDFSKGMIAHYDFYKIIMLKDPLPLSKPQREYLAVATSKANKCPYCISHHEAAYDFSNENISKLEKEIFVKLSKELSNSPWKSYLIKKEFKNNGFTNSQWQHAVMIVSYFNFVNRLALAMNLPLEDSFQNSCK